MKQNLTQDELARLLEYVRATTGTTLPETNYLQTGRFVLDRIQTLGCPFAEYLSRLESDPTERAAFIDVVTINETYFFREERQFSLLLSQILPELRARGRFPVRLWSAACATGEEALSLYFAAADALGSDNRFTVCASDVSGCALSAFAEGRYSANSFRPDGSRFHDLVRAAATRSGGRTEVPGEILSRIRRATVNLDRFAGSPFGTRFDVILLRNVVMYFDREKRAGIIDRVAGLLEDGGYLLLSATEVPLVANRELDLREWDGVFYFRKKTIQERNAGLIIDSNLIKDVEREEATARPAAAARPAADYDLIISYTNAKLSNHLFALPDDPNYSLALRLIEILYSVNSQDFGAAEPALGDFERAAGAHEVVHYLRGYMLTVRGDAAGGIEEFGKALAHNPRFWPARFRRAMLLAGSGQTRKAGKEFGTCMADIDAYIERNSYAYDFLLEGFNGKYFRCICERRLEKLNRQGTSHES